MSKRSSKSQPQVYISSPRIKEDDLLQYFDSSSPFLQAFEKRTLKAGDTLIREGEEQKEFYIIDSGTVVKTKDSYEGQTFPIMKGVVTGILHVYAQDSSHATIKAETDAQVRVMSAEKLHSLLSKDPALNGKFISFLSKQVRTQFKSLARLQKEHPEESSSFSLAFFDTKKYEKLAFTAEMQKQGLKYSVSWYEERLSSKTAPLAFSHDAVCAFVSDEIDSSTVQLLKEGGVGLIAMRCAGYDNVDLKATKQLGLSVTRVPAYSPYAVAEFAVTLMMALNRKIVKAYNRVRDYNFSISGLVGFDMHGKTVGIIGTGKIGRIVGDICSGFGCELLGFDPYPSDEFKQKGKYVEMDELLAKSDIISIHAPLTPKTKHTINSDNIAKLKDGAMIINTSRGPLIDTTALRKGIESGKIGAAGLDVVEGEKGVFFEDFSDNERAIEHENIKALLAYKNVIITSHQAFLTQEALSAIASSTLGSIKEYVEGKRGDDLTNAVKQEY